MPSPSFCRSTSLLHVRDDHASSRGRHAIASRDATAGTVVTRSAPLAHVLRDEHKSERCARCLSDSKRHYGDAEGEKRLSRCSRCRAAWYCGRDCQRADFPFHKVECKRGSEAPAAIKEEAELLLRAHVALDSMDVGASEECRVCPGSDGCRSEDEGARIIRCGRRHFGAMARSCKSLDSTDRLTVEIVQRLCRGRWRVANVEDALRAFKVNNFGIVDCMLNVVGSGVYPHAAILNHSCDPNCVIRYDFANVSLGPVMEIVAVRDISEGEELTHSYIDLVHPTETRRARLTEAHCFNCSCRRCAGLCTIMLPTAFPDQQPNEIVEWIISCHNPFSSSFRAISDISAMEVDIDDAMKRCVAPSILPASEVAKARHHATLSSQLMQEEALQHMQLGDTETEIKCLEHAVSELSEHSVVPLFSVELYTAHGALLSSLLVLGKTNEALRSCKFIVAFLCVALGNITNHPLLGLQVFTLGDLFAATGDGVKAREAHMWARHILKICYGKQYEMVHRLDALLDE